MFSFFFFCSSFFVFYPFCIWALLQMKPKIQPFQTMYFFLSCSLYYEKKRHIHMNICHFIASIIIMKTIVMVLEYSESVMASNRVGSLRRNTHTHIERVDIDILICGTVCSRSHVQSPHTPPAWFTYTHISSFLWQVRWQVVPSGLAIHGHWNSNIIHSIFCSNANRVSRNWYRDKESY